MYSVKNFNKINLENNMSGEVNIFFPDFQKYYIPPKQKFRTDDIDLSIPISNVTNEEKYNIIKLEPKI